MKKLFLFILTSCLLLGFGAPVLAATAKKKVVTPVKKTVVAPKKIVKKTAVAPVKKPVAKASNVVIAVKAKQVAVAKTGISGEIDYENKIFTLNIKGYIFTVNAKKAKVYVPVITKAVSIDNLTEEMELRVWGIVDNEKKTIEATQIRMIK